MPTPIWTRLEIAGEYVMDSPFHIGDGSPEDGIALDLAGRPMIPASTFRGALRAHTESMLRAMNSEAMQVIRQVEMTGIDRKPVSIMRKVGLACESVDKPANSLNYQGCLTEAIVVLWTADPLLQSTLDRTLNDCTCMACRLFGTAWLRGKLHLTDLSLIDKSWGGNYALRGGITLSRDTDTMIEGSAYLRRGLPPGLRFSFRLVVQDASLEEQGALLLALRAFEIGWIPLGGDRARGLGNGHLEIDWWRSRYTDTDTFIQSLLNREPLLFSEAEAEARIGFFADFVNGMMRKPRD